VISYEPGDETVESEYDTWQLPPERLQAFEGLNVPVMLDDDRSTVPVGMWPRTVTWQDKGKPRVALAGRLHATVVLDCTLPI
jgi:hypothetical protein